MLHSSASDIPQQDTNALHGDEDISNCAKPSLADVWQSMASEGDILGLLSALADGMQRGISARPLLAHLHVAIDVLARRDPNAFSQFVAREMLSTVGGLTIRCNFYLSQLVAANDERTLQSRSWSPSRELEDFLPKMMELQLHFFDLVRLNASAERLTTLARQHELKNRETVRRHRRERHRRKRLKDRFSETDCGG